MFYKYPSLATILGPPATILNAFYCLHSLVEVSFYGPIRLLEVSPWVCILVRHFTLRPAPLPAKHSFCTGKEERRRREPFSGIGFPFICAYSIERSQSEVDSLPALCAFTAWRMEGCILLHFSWYRQLPVGRRGACLPTVHLRKKCTERVWVLLEEESLPWDLPPGETCLPFYLLTCATSAWRKTIPVLETWKDLFCYLTFILEEGRKCLPLTPPRSSLPAHVLGRTWAGCLLLPLYHCSRRNIRLVSHSGIYILSSILIHPVFGEDGGLIQPENQKFSSSHPADRPTWKGWEGGSGISAVLPGTC